MTISGSDETIEEIARSSYGRLLAFLSARAGGNFAAAEDALGEAFLKAMKAWPGEGVPRNPEAWLLTAARRKLIDYQRKAQVHTKTMEDLQTAMYAAEAVVEAGDGFPDERLKLLFVCAHPAIDVAARTPLMLQTVFGFEAAQISPAFLSTAPAMAQRLVRAKVKIRDAGIPFQVPLPRELPERLDNVLEAIYAAYTAGWEEVGPLAASAIWLGRMLAQLLPEEPEPLGLLALMLHTHARRAARADAEGNYVPLPEQEVARWDMELIQEAEALLSLAARRRQPGRFQLEAAIQSVHAQRLHTGRTEWAAIVQLYAALLRIAPAIGARIGHAAAIAQAAGPGAGLEVLEGLPVERVEAYQPYWATRAHLLAQLGRREEARVAYGRAIELAADRGVRVFLEGRMRESSVDGPPSGCGGGCVLHPP